MALTEKKSTAPHCSAHITDGSDEVMFAGAGWGKVRKPRESFVSPGEDERVNGDQDEANTQQSFGEHLKIHGAIIARLLGVLSENLKSSELSPGDPVNQLMRPPRRF